VTHDADGRPEEDSGLPVPQGGLSAAGREAAALRLAPPLAVGRDRALRVAHIRAEREPLGLTRAEAAELRSLAILTGRKIAGVFPGSTDLRIPGADAAASAGSGPALESDLSGESVAPVVSMLLAAQPREGARLSLSFRGVTHPRSGFGVPQLDGAYRRLAERLGVFLVPGPVSLGLGPSGEGAWSGDARVTPGPSGGEAVLDLRERGPIVSARVEVRAARGRAEVLERAAAVARKAFWEKLRLEPSVSVDTTRVGSPGLSVSIDLTFAAGAATFAAMQGRIAGAEDVAHRAARQALRFLDTTATTDDATSLEIAALAAGRGAGLCLRVPRSAAVSDAHGVLVDLGWDSGLAEDEGLLAWTIRPPRDEREAA
jgi:RNA 3'-terminal phosphate cyclase